jgi:hypothetical protein
MSSPNELVRIETRRKSDSDANHEEGVIEVSCPTFETRILVVAFTEASSRTSGVFQPAEGSRVLLSRNGSAARQILRSA